MSQHYTHVLSEEALKEATEALPIFRSLALGNEPQPRVITSLSLAGAD